MTNKHFLLIGLTGLLAACGTQATREGQSNEGAMTSAAVPGQLVVKYKEGVRSAAMSAMSGATVLSATTPDAWGSLTLVAVPKGQEQAYAEKYAARADVEYAEPNYIFTRDRDERLALNVTSQPTLRAQADYSAGVTDPYFVNSPVDGAGKNPFDIAAGQAADGKATYTGEKFLWGLNRIRAPQAWNAGFTGKGVVVAVIDEGTELNHPDIKPNLWTNPNPNSTTCPGVNGYDFTDDDTNPNDTGGHGTHTAGTIAAAANGQGVVGVAPEAKLMVLRALGYQGGTNFMLARALKYAADCGAQVVNNSWGGSQKTRAFGDVVLYGTGKGTTYVFSSGNSFRDNNRPSWPVGYSQTIAGAIGVGSISNDNRRTGFSNAGPYVTVAAPGSAIMSTVPVAQNPSDPYAFLQGTSMAAPHVAGVVALLYQAKPDITPEQVRLALTTTANSSITGQSSRPDYPTGGSYGFGIVNAQAATAFAAAPTNFR